MDWNKLSQKNKDEISKQKPIFIWGSRWISDSRIIQLKKLAEKRKVIWGILKDEFIPGLEGSLQFKTLKKDDLSELIEDNLNIEILEYFQRDLKFILDELSFSLCILINGSWHKALHFNPEFWQLMNKKIEYKLISPFTSETEAKQFEAEIQNEYSNHKVFDSKRIYDEKEIMKIVAEEAKRSWDWNYQIAAAVAKDGKVIGTNHNTVVPYESYSTHFGSIREKNFSTPGDLNHYDTIHAEVKLVLELLKNKISLDGASLYINVLPCPNCTLMLTQTGIQEVVYSQDHSEGFAIKMLEKSGIKVRRLII